MADALEQGRYVLGGILPDRLDRLEKALRVTKDEHFIDPHQRAMWKLLLRHYDVTGVVLTPHSLDTYMSRVDDYKAMAYVALYEALSPMQMDDADFALSVAELKDLYVEKTTMEALTSAVEIARDGKELPTGEHLVGHEDARSFLSSQLTLIDRDLVSDAVPEGDLKKERESVLQDYQDRKAARAAGLSRGVLTGVATIDRAMGGMQRGELVLSVGYSSDGKSSLCVQTAWSAAVEQRKNVVFFTTETVRDQIRRKLIARHSRLPVFGLPSGLNSRSIKDGTLTASEETKFVEVVSDYTQNSAYGHIYIAQVARNSTISTLEGRLHRIGQMMEVDLVIMDYLALLSPETRRQSDREQMASILREAKQVAVTYQNGRGVPFMSPWQVSRAARERADKEGGRYTSAALAETSEATNSADSILSILAPMDNTDRMAELTAQVLKNRDGERADGLYLDVDYATSWFAPKSSLSGAVGQFGLAATTYQDDALLEAL